GEGHDLLFSRLEANRADFSRLATTEVEHHLRCEFKARKCKLRIDTALEAITRIGDDAELTARASDVERRPERRLDQHVGRVLVATRMLAAHDAGDGFHALVVSDDAVLARKRVLATIERQDLFAFLGTADHQ